MVLLINQTREKIGVLYGNPETTPGAKALRYILTMNMRVKKVGDIVDDKTKEPLGFEMYVQILKNGLGVSVSSSESNNPIFYNQGTIARASGQSVLNRLSSAGKLVRAGAWWRLIVPNEDAEKATILHRWPSKSALLASLEDEAMLARLRKYEITSEWDDDAELD